MHGPNLITCLTLPGCQAATSCMHGKSKWQQHASSCCCCCCWCIFHEFLLQRCNTLQLVLLLLLSDRTPLHAQKLWQANTRSPCSTFIPSPASQKIAPKPQSQPHKFSEKQRRIMSTAPVCDERKCICCMHTMQKPPYRRQCNHSLRYS